MLCCVCVFVCFFFQAEDGIRDYKVTGVQTCALPIYSLPRPYKTPSCSPPFALSKLGRRRIDAASGFANDGTVCRNVSAPTAAIAAWSVAHTFLQLFDPCVRWDDSKSSQSDNSKTSQGSGAGLGPHGPCRIGNCHDSWSRARKHCAGNDRCGRATTAVGSIPMLCETPVAFTIAPLALVTGLLSLLFARRIPCAAVDTPVPMGRITHFPVFPTFTPTPEQKFQPFLAR